MKKKVFLAVALLALMTVGAFAQYTAESNFQVTRSGNAVTITRYVGASLPSELNIPPTIQNLPVTEIGGSVFTTGMANVTSLTIPASVTNIQSMAFYSLANLRSVTFLGTIPSSGFHSANSFQGDLRTKFYATDRNNGTPGTYTKSGTTWTLTPAAAPATSSANSPNDFLYSTTTDGRGIVIDVYRGTATTVRIPDRINNLPVVEIEQDAFSIMNGKALITSVVIPNTVTKIGDSAFNRQPNLTSVTLPSSLIEIGANAFSECIALTSITFPASLRTIGARAFDKCTALTTVTIPASVTRITFAGTIIFRGCTALNAASRTALQRVGYTGTF